MSLEQPFSAPGEEREIENEPRKFTEEELERIDPESGLSWRELTFGVSSRTLKDLAKGKEPSVMKKNIFTKLFSEKNEKKKVSKEEALEIIHSYHEMIDKLHLFLSDDAQRYFPDLSPDVAQAEMALSAVQQLMRSQDPASVEAIRDILKNEENFVEIGGERKRLYDILFPHKRKWQNGSSEDKKMKDIPVSPNISIATKDPALVEYLSENGKTEVSVDDALRAVRYYFDRAAKIHGMLESEAREFYPKVGETEENNRLAILALESCIRLRDRLSLEAVKGVLRKEEKYMSNNPGTPLAELFARLKPHISAIENAKFD